MVESLKLASFSATHLTQVHTLSLSLYAYTRSRLQWVPFTTLGAGSEAHPVSIADLTSQQCGRGAKIFVSGLHFGSLWRKLQDLGARIMIALTCPQGPGYGEGEVYKPEVL